MFLACDKLREAKVGTSFRTVLEESVQYPSVTMCLVPTTAAVLVVVDKSTETVLRPPHNATLGRDVLWSYSSTLANGSK